MSLKKSTLITPILLILAPCVAWAAPGDVVIDEVAWMGTSISANDEWLELYNSSTTEIDLTGWRLEAADGSPKISLAGKIPTDGFFLLERTDDDTVPGIAADQIYTGSLSNTGEDLKLYDGQNNVIDEVNALAGWPAGENDAKKTMERSAADVWQTSAEAGGTPKAKNSLVETPTAPPPDDGSGDSDDAGENSGQVNLEPSPGAAVAPALPKIPDAKAGDIIITEIFPNPLGPDNEGEFIELKNVSRANIDLGGWKITNKAKQIFEIEPQTLAPQSFAVFYRPKTLLVLNNDK